MKIGHVASKTKTTEMRSILEKNLSENLQFLVTLKFTFSEKAAKIDKIFTVDLTLTKHARILLY